MALEQENEDLKARICHRPEVGACWHAPHPHAAACCFVDDDDADGLRVEAAGVGG